MAMYIFWVSLAGEVRAGCQHCLLESVYLLRQCNSRVVAAYVCSRIQQLYPTLLAKG